MRLQLTIVAADGAPLTPGSSLRVEVRDTSLADAPAIVLQRVDVPVDKSQPTPAVSVPVELPVVPDGTTIWAHLDVNHSGRVSPGDYVSVESYPVSQAPVQHTTIRLQKVR